MKKPLLNYQYIPILLTFAFFALMLYSGHASAGEHMMQKNLSNLSNLTSKWSKELESGKLTPEAQQKLAELLSLTSQVLQDMSEKSGAAMDMEHSAKIEAMKKEWDPFDTSDKM